MELDSKLFSLNRETHTYAAEASTLGIPPGHHPESVTIVIGQPSLCAKLDFRFQATEKDVSGEDIAGWRYVNNAGTSVLIIND